MFRLRRGSVAPGESLFGLRRCNLDTVDAVEAVAVETRGDLRYVHHTRGPPLFFRLARVFLGDVLFQTLVVGFWLEWVFSVWVFG